MTTSTKILLDRMAHALNAQGISLKRSQLLEVASAAFGYHNSGEMTAAARTGALTPPPAIEKGEVHLSDGTAMTVLFDPLAGSPYAIDQTFIEQVIEDERREKFGVSPYGHLLDLTHIGNEPIPKLDTPQPSSSTGVGSVITIHIAYITHRHGIDTFHAFSNDALQDLVAEYCEDNWSDISHKKSVPDYPYDLSRDEKIDTYFDCHDSENWESLTIDIDLNGQSKSPPPPAATPDSIGISRRQEEDPTWVTDENGQDTKSSNQFENLGPIDHKFLCPGTVLDLGSLKARMGFSIFYQGQLWIAPDISFSWEDPDDENARAKALTDLAIYEAAKRPNIEKLGGHLIRTEDAQDNAHELAILLPLDLIYQAANVEAWQKALTYLLSPGTETNQAWDSSRVVIATFLPQIDLGRHVVPVNPEGADSWDATWDVLLLGSERMGAILDGSHDADDFARSPLAPQWVQEWAGKHPFEVDIHDAAIRYLNR